MKGYFEIGKKKEKKLYAYSFILNDKTLVIDTEYITDGNRYNWDGGNEFLIDRKIIPYNGERDSWSINKMIKDYCYGVACDHYCGG